MFVNVCLHVFFHTFVLSKSNLSIKFQIKHFFPLQIIFKNALSSLTMYWYGCVASEIGSKTNSHTMEKYNTKNDVTICLHQNLTTWLLQKNWPTYCSCPKAPEKTPGNNQCGHTKDFGTECRKKYELQYLGIWCHVCTLLCPPPPPPPLRKNSWRKVTKLLYQSKKVQFGLYINLSTIVLSPQNPEYYAVHIQF